MFSRIRLKWFSVLVLFAIYSHHAHAAEVDHSITQSVQESVFQKTAALLHLTPNRPRPRVLNVQELTPQERVDFCTEGACGAKGEFAVNNYSVQKNVVLLTPDARVDQLAHEFTHYFQVQYQTLAEGTDPEDEAVWVQNQFR